MSLRRLLNNYDDDNWDPKDHSGDEWGDAVDDAEKAVKIGIGIIIAIVVGIIIFVIVSVIICIYCVCKKRTVSSGTVVQRSAVPNQQVTTYNFTQGQQPPPPQGYGPGYPPAPGPHPYPPVASVGVQPPPYTPQTVPPGFSDKQKASAPPME